MLAHPGQPPAPHDLWGAWNTDPLMAGAFVAAAVGYRVAAARRPRRPGDRRRAVSFAGAMVALAVALLSPLDALSSALASAHMVQHLLLVLVAAPLLAWSAPWTTVWRGSPAAVHRATGRWRRRLRPGRRNTLAQYGGLVWLLHVATLWFWHAAVPYQAALDHEAVHAVEHATLLGTAVLFWVVVVATRRARGSSAGVGVLLLFAATMQSVFLSLLLTFAGTAWYPGYAHTTAPWGLDPLADQQLAGVIMWVPGGVVYLGTAMTLLVTWVRTSEPAADHAAP